MGVSFDPAAERQAPGLEAEKQCPSVPVAEMDSILSFGLQAEAATGDPGLVRQATRWKSMCAPAPEEAKALARPTSFPAREREAAVGLLAQVLLATLHLDRELRGRARLDRELQELWDRAPRDREREVTFGLVLERQAAKATLPAQAQEEARLCTQANSRYDLMAMPRTTWSRVWSTGRLGSSALCSSLLYYA